MVTTIYDDCGPIVNWFYFRSTEEIITKTFWLDYYWRPDLLGYCLVLNYNIRGAGQKMIGIKALTAEGQQRWRQKYGQPLKYVGGEDNLYQWFIIYASDRPHTIQPLGYQ